MTSSAKSSKKSAYDALVIGAGHNGLVAAGYLQRAGVRTLVLEARSMVGGACVTEEVFPGYRVSTTSYVCSLLRPKIISDLELLRHGLDLIERDPSSFTPFPNGRSLMFWADQRKTCEEIAKFSRKDAENFPKYEALLSQLAEFVEPLLLSTPPDPLSSRVSDLWEMAKLGLKARGMGENVYEKLRVLTQSATDFLDRWFESDELKATLATDAVIGAFVAPSTPGTAYILLHHVMGETFGRKGVWAYVRGGMGGVTQAMASSFVSLGGEIRTNARVKRILIRDGRAYGVLLENGEEIFANRIVSNADPKRTFIDMIEEADIAGDLREKVGQIRFRSATFKVNLGLSAVPNWKALPNLNGQPGPQHHGTMHVCPTMEYIEQAYDDARRGYCSEKPILECTMASVLDPSLAPAGKHVMSIFTQYAPYAPKDGPWTEAKKLQYAQRCIDLIDEYAPGFKGSVEHVHTLSPVDMEREYGLTGGSISQGEMTLDRLFFMRPIPELARYRTPVKNLYLCGAGTHPGGGVMGAPGHNAAHEILKESRF